MKRPFLTDYERSAIRQGKGEIAIFSYRVELLKREAGRQFAYPVIEWLLSVLNKIKQ